jgi:glycosyltransferase involved in cell wall biosynthesis
MIESATGASPAPRHVLYLTTSFGTLGPATALVELALRLDPARYRPVMAQLGPRQDGLLERRLADAGVPVHSLGTSGPRAIPALVRIARETRAAVLHTRLVRADFLGRLAGRLAGVPLVITNLCDVYTRHFADRHGATRGAWLRRLDQATLPLAHHVVTNAEGVRDDLIEHAIVLPDRVTTISNGVDIARYRRDVEAGAAIRRELGLAEDAWVIGTVSRLSSKKRHDVLIDAMPHVRAVAPDARLLIVGDGELGGALRSRVHAVGLGDMVTFTGVRSDVPAVLSAMDVFAFPSDFEGCPNAVLEAMSASLPVVGADVPGTREVVLATITGLLEAPGDSRALADGLLSYRNRARALQAGLAGRQAVEQHFSLDAMACRFQDFYDRHLPPQERA